MKIAILMSTYNANQFLEKQLIRNDAITMRYLKTEGEHNDNTEQKLE